MPTGNPSRSSSRSMPRTNRFAFKRIFAFWTVLFLAALLPNSAFARSWRIADFKDTISVGRMAAPWWLNALTSFLSANGMVSIE